MLAQKVYLMHIFRMVGVVAREGGGLGIDSRALYYLWFRKVES